MAATDEILVLTAINEEEKATEFLVDLVSDGLILSGTFYPVKVVYFWEGEVHIDEEYKVVMKSREGHFADIEKYIIENHHYRAPEVIKVNASFGSDVFKKYLTDNKKMV